MFFEGLISSSKINLFLRGDIIKFDKYRNKGIAKIIIAALNIKKRGSKIMELIWIKEGSRREGINIKTKIPRKIIRTSNK